MARPLLIKPRPALDEAWYRQLRQAAPAANYIYAVLGPSQEAIDALKVKAASADYRDCPDFRPDGAASDILAMEAEALHALRERISHDEPDQAIRQAYLERIEELETNIALYRAACDGDAARFQQLNERLYGPADRRVYRVVIAELRALAAGRSGPAAQAVLSALPKPDTDEDTVRLRPDEPVYQAVRNLHIGENGFFARLAGGLKMPSGKLVTSVQGDAYLRGLLHALQADYTIVDSPSGYWGVSHDVREVLRPAGYVMPAEAFVAIVAHEIGSHLLERLNGERQPLRLLAYGLAGYERGNEGRALMREQVAYPTWRAFAITERWLEIICRHLTISVAAGLPGRRFDFQETFSLIRAVIQLWQEVYGPAAGVTPEEAAWRVVARALKGTDGRGGAYYKDKVYLEGNIACWQEAARDPEMILLGDAGKFDICRPDHRKMLL